MMYKYKMHGIAAHSVSQPAPLLATHTNTHAF